MDPNNRHVNPNEYDQQQHRYSTSPRTSTASSSSSTTNPRGNSSSYIQLRASTSPGEPHQQQQHQQQRHHYDVANNFSTNNSNNRTVSVLSLGGAGGGGNVLNNNSNQPQLASSTSGTNIIGRRSSSSSAATSTNLNFVQQQQQQSSSNHHQDDIPPPSTAASTNRPMTAQQRLMQLQQQNQQNQQQSATTMMRSSPSSLVSSSSRSNNNNNTLHQHVPGRTSREPTPPGVEEDAPQVPPNQSSSTARVQQSNIPPPASGKVNLSHHHNNNNNTGSSSAALPLPPSSTRPPAATYEDMNMFSSSRNGQQHQAQQADHFNVTNTKTNQSASASASSSKNVQPHHVYQPTVEEIEHSYQRNKIKNNEEDDEQALHEDCSSIDDAVFIRECVFAMLASCDSLEFSSWDSRNQEYTPLTSAKSACGASPRQRDIYNRFALKLGTMRRRIRTLLEGPTTSFLQQSLRRAVERQLVSYSRFISSLNDSSSSSSSSSRIGGKQRSISDVQVAYLRAMPKLTALYTALQNASKSKGGELVSKLEALNHHGGEELSSLLHDVYRETVMPLLYMTLQWLTKGACSDPYLEFFVTINKAVPESSDRYWYEKFALQPNMIPSTFTQEQAELIQLVGKNINFLQKCCKVRDWRMSDHIIKAAEDATFDSVDVVIRGAVADTNASVLKVLNEKFLLVQAFQRARLVYLLANGDFANVIMEKLDPHLNSPANLVSTTGVQDALHNAVASLASILPSCMNDAAPHIAAEINIPPSTSNPQQDSPYTGWDVFSMSLPFPPPYNTFFTTETLRVYRKLFRLLWKVKRAEVELKKAWQLYNMADRKFVNSGKILTSSDNNNDDDGNSENTSLNNTDNGYQSNNSEDENAASPKGRGRGRPTKKGATKKNANNKKTNNITPAVQQQETEHQRRLRQLSAMAFRHLTHFVTNFQMYLVTEVIEIAWQKLTRDLAQCTSVDEIIAAHNSYLNYMLKYAMLKTSHTSSSQQHMSSNTTLQSTTQMLANISALLNKMLNVTLEFCAAYRSIVHATYSHSSSSQSSSTTSAILTPSVNTAIQRCQRTISTIETGISDFLTILEEDDARGGQRLEFLNSLASRLNFNFFYGVNDRSSSVGSTNSTSGGSYSIGRSGRLF